MLIVKIMRSIVRTIFVVTTLASMGTLVEATYDMAIYGSKESKQDFLSISKLNRQLHSALQTP